MSNAFPRPVRFLSIPFLVALTTFLSCQERPTSPKDSGPFEVSKTSTMDSIRMPDSATWSHKGTSGTFTLTRIDKETFKVSTTFPQSIASDTLVLTLWRLGLRTTVTPCLVQTDGSLIVASSSPVLPDSNVVKLLRSFDSLRNLDHIAYGSASDPIAAQILSLRKATAFLVLSGNRSLQTLPTGMDSTAVVAQILVLGSNSGLSIAVVAKTISLSATSLEALAKTLFENGTLKPADSSSLYPAYPVRVRSALSVTGPVTAGGSSVSVNGAFVWAKGYRVSGEYQVKSSKGPESGFQFLVQKPIQLSDTTWTLSDNFSLLASSDAAAGTDTLVVTISDDSGHVATARAVFQVIAKEVPKPDTTAPTIALVSPKTDTSVPNTVQSLNVEVVAADSVGVDSVKINGVKLTNAPYKVTVPLAIGANPVTAQAWDKAGNASKKISLTILRANSPGDTIAPRITRSSPKGKDTTVDYTTSTAILSYLVTDDSLLTSVSLDGTPLSSTTGLYQTVVDLPVGSKSFVLMALDKHGNPARDTVTIVRRKDTTKPVVSPASPSADTTVSYGATSLTISVSASDIAGIDSVKIGGIKSASTASPYTATVALKPGANTIAIEAFDKFGNSTSRQLKITHAAAADSIAPAIARTAPLKDSITVSATTASYDLSWTVSDDSTVASVKLNGTVLTTTTGIYNSTQSLSAGTNVFTLEAKDARGNTKLDQVKIVRLTDPFKPAATWQGGSKDTTVWAFVPSLTAAWKVTDNALKLVTINGAPVGGSNEIYSQVVSLATDTSWIRLMALDSSGNTLWDSVRVVRKYDKTAPAVAFQKAKSRLVANAVTADTLAWTVSDNLKLKSVKVNGNDLTVSGSKYTSIVNLTVGTHRYVLVATDSAGNESRDTATIARTALPATHSTAAGRYIGTVYDTLSSPGADSILYSTNGADWKRATGPLSFTSSVTVYAKAMPGEQFVPAAYTVSQVKSIACGGFNGLGSAYSLFLMTDGSVWETPTAFRSSVVKRTMTGVTDLTSYNNHGDLKNFFKMSDNSWYGEGSNQYGDLGIGFESSSVSLSQVMLSDVQQIAAGNGETYFLRKDGTVWGAGSLGVKINGANPTVGGMPVQIVAYPNDTLKDIVEIKAGFLYGEGVPNVVALDSKGNLWAWADSIPKILVSNVKSASITSVLLALMKDGTVSGMGYNNFGQIGDGSMSTTGAGFSQSLGLTSITAISNGGYQSLFLRNDGTLLVSGMTEVEVIAPGKGNGPITLSPTQVSTEVVGIWSGFDGGFFKKTDGTLWCIGNPKAGMDADTVSATPRRVNF